MEILGIIPARGGSKAIPNKNIVDLFGKPLLAYTCEASLNSKRLSRVILSTDEKKIAAVGRKFGVPAPFLRPKQLAQDSTPMLPVITHALEFLKAAEGYKPDIVVLLQPTSPFRTSQHIDRAVTILMKSNADSVVSVVAVPHQFSPVSVMKLAGGKLIPITEGPHILRRQDKPKVYARNGPAVLASRCETICGKKSLYGDQVLPFIMLEEESLDIDTLFDLEMARFFLARQAQRTRRAPRLRPQK